MKFTRWVGDLKWRCFRLQWFRKTKKRICARCEQPIKRGHKWSAKAWTNDPRPRHWDCKNPTGSPALALFVENEVNRITEEVVHE